MYVLKNSGECNRLGISVSKKVGNSVVRHRVTRLVRESYRLHENIFNSGLDIVVVARNNAGTASYAEIESALLHLGKLHHIVKIFFMKFNGIFVTFENNYEKVTYLYDSIL